MSDRVREAPAPWPAGTDTLQPRWSRRVTTVDPDGTPLSWHLLDTDPDAGPATPTLLCVHGNPTWSYLWRRVAAAAPAGWRVVAPDQLGMGWSERTVAPRTLATRIEDLGRLTAALGLTGPVTILAHDWGGPVALGWALAHRELLQAVILTNTAVHQPAAVAPPAVLRLASTIRTTVCVRTPAFVRATAALSRPALPHHVRHALAAPYRTAVRRQAVGDFVADIPFTADHPSAGTLATVAGGVATLDVPALILWGARDPVFQLVHLRDLQRRLPHADVQLFPTASHLVTEDVPELAAQVWQWLTGPGVPAPHREGATIPDVPIWAALDRYADDPAPAVVELSGQGRAVGFDALSGRVRDLAAGLAAAGVGTGERVAVLIPPGADLTATVYACWRAGAVVVLADAGLGLRALGRALRSATPDHVIGIPVALAAATALRVPGRRIAAAGAGRFPGVATLDELVAAGRDRPLPTPPTATDEAAVLFTSGATGPAKGVVYGFAELHAQLAQVRRTLRIGPEDRFVAAFAPFALYGPALGLPTAVPAMDVTRPGTLTASALAAAVAAVQATVVFAAPAALRNVVATAGQLGPAERVALAGVRTVLSAGAPVEIELLERVAALLPAAELHTPYGMTEALPVTDVDLTELRAAGAGEGVCVGRPVPGVRVRIAALDAAGVPSGPGDDTPGVTGEIDVAAAHVRRGYDRRWLADRASWTPDGWHRTGDVGHLDDQGRLWVEGRLVHVIATAAGPVTPVGPEQRLSRLPDVSAAAVVGVGPAGTQQVVVVVVVSRPRRGRRDVVASVDLAAAVRAAAGVPVSAVLVVPRLPVDIRHQSKVDRTAVARWAERVLAGGRTRLGW